MPCLAELPELIRLKYLTTVSRWTTLRGPVAQLAEATEQDLLAWCREHLPDHQIPALVTFTGRLPRNSAGKLIRARLHDTAALTAHGHG